MCYEYCLYCNTEGRWKYVWSKTPPIECPQSDKHDIDLKTVKIRSTLINRILIWDDIEDCLDSSDGSSDDFFDFSFIKNHLL